MVASQSDSIINLLEKPLKDPKSQPVLVKVIGGDTVSQLVSKYYDTHIGSKTYQLAVAQLKRHNPRVTDLNKIQIGQILKFMPMPGVQEINKVELPKQFDPMQIPATSLPFDCYVCTPYVPMNDDHFALQMPDTEEALEVFHKVSWFEENWFNLTTMPTGAGLTGLSTLTGSTNTALLHEVKTAYDLKQAGKITKGAYDYRRRMALKKLSEKLGSTEKLFFKGKTAQEAVRISRVKGVPATDHVLRNAARFNKISKVSGTGGSILLAGASLGYGCYEIGKTLNQQEQNEIMVETVGGLAGGAVAGLVLVTGPVGIGLALVIGVGSVVAGVVAGKLSKGFYNRYLKEVDLVGMSGVRGFCG